VVGGPVGRRSADRHAEPGYRRSSRDRTSPRL